MATAVAADSNLLLAVQMRGWGIWTGGNVAKQRMLLMLPTIRGLEKEGT